MTKRKANSGSFKKGQSGNPKGRKPELPELRERFKEAAGEALALALVVLRGKTEERKDQIAAARIVLEWGLPKPAPELGGGNLEKLEAIARALRGDDGDDA